MLGFGLTVRALRYQKVCIINYQPKQQGQTFCMWMCIVMTCLLSSPVPFMTVFQPLSLGLSAPCETLVLLGACCVYSGQKTPCGEEKACYWPFRVLSHLVNLLSPDTCPCYLKYTGNMKLCIESGPNILSCNSSETQIYELQAVKKCQSDGRSEVRNTVGAGHNGICLLHWRV